jgi:hypothetical protein
MLQDELAGALGVRKSQLSKFKARGCPVDDEGKARLWISANIRPRGRKKKPLTNPDGEPTQGIPPREEPSPPDVFSWEARLDRARKTELDTGFSSK